MINSEFRKLQNDGAFGCTLKQLITKSKHMEVVREFLMFYNQHS